MKALTQSCIKKQSVRSKEIMSVPLLIFWLMWLSVCASLSLGQTVTLVSLLDTHKLSSVSFYPPTWCMQEAQLLFADVLEASPIEASVQLQALRSHT